MGNNKKKKKKQGGQGGLFHEKNVIIAVAAMIVLAGVGLAIWSGRGKQEEEKKAAKREQVSEDEVNYDPLECVELGDYAGLEISLKVTKSDLKFEVESILEEHAEYEQLSGVAAEGDMVYADFEGYVGGKLVDATSGSDYIEIGSGEWLEGFESGLIGANTGETAVFSVAVPEGTYGDPAIDGQTVEFHVKVHYICGEEILPEYNDDFVKSISKKYRTVKQYNTHLRKKLKKENEEQKAEFAWSDLLSSCKVKKYPKALLAEAKEEVLQGYYDMAELYGCSQEEIFSVMGYGSQQEFMDTELKVLAKDTAKEYLVAQAVAAKEGLQYTTKEFQALRDEEYSYVQDSYDTVEAYEADKKGYLEHQTILKMVKEWLSAQVKYLR